MTMCEPTTIAYGVAAVVAAVSGYGTYTSQKQAQYNADFQAKVSENNATLARQQGEQAREATYKRGSQEAIKAQREAERLRGAQVVRLAGNGLDLNSGSPLAILEDTDYFGAMDANQIRQNAEREGALQAWGYAAQAGNFDASAGMYQTASRNANPGGAAALSAGTSLLSSAGQFAGAKAGQKVKLNSAVDSNIANSGLY